MTRQQLGMRLAGLRAWIAGLGQTFTQRLANPARFMELSGKLMPWLSGAAAALLIYGLYLVFFASPPDYQQGETVRIMYIHVPSAWLAMMG